uniref:Uncharacterized protein n=2 Tax=Arion vulgaris TaxID=1028688 RepID=A0A0B6ZRL5_9EUPU
MLVVKPIWKSMAEAPQPPSKPNGASSEQETMDAGVATEDFISTGRTGRRNAVPDISDPRIGTVSTASMDFSFDKLSVTDSKSGPADGAQTGSSNKGNNPDQPSKS